ncbi:flavin reductase [Micromonospora sp. WMMD1082]|uniref:flavin reductase n=1 Tax=Micromonospora sp. WMMD1082 TaxID=3016104 RepID=UPI00241792A0|nr:flavin reductase [Micromonospora sp. WMMD1082]MDG4792981.1 flavin reductase [Micromonospora sp. WMMD1082]
MQRHAPVKPMWFCAACAHPWPCGVARLHLAAEYVGKGRAFAIEMAELLWEATADLERIGGNPDGFELYGRFLGWIRRASRPPDPGAATD